VNDVGRFVNGVFVWVFEIFQVCRSIQNRLCERNHHIITTNRCCVLGI